MQETLNEMPGLQQDEQTIVSTRAFNASRKMVYEVFAEKKGVAA